MGNIVQANVICVVKQKKGQRMKVEVKTLFNKCAEGCVGFDVTEDHGEFKCSKEWLCRYGAMAMLGELQERFEHEEHEAYKSDIAGMKEHKVWNKALRILEEYIDER